jgi:hypothetical protein
VGVPPPSPARANFSLITECTPQSSGCYSVYSVAYTYIYESSQNVQCIVYNVRVQHPFLLNPPTTRPSSFSSFPNDSWCGITARGNILQEAHVFFCLLNFSSNTRFPLSYNSHTILLDFLLSVQQVQPAFHSWRGGRSQFLRSGI